MEDINVATCQRCGCTFVFRMSDTYIEYPTPYNIIECPKCRSRIWLGSGDKGGVK